MAARQNHGFVFETAVMEILGVQPSLHYTAKYDGVLGGVPVSIKTVTAGGELCMGSLERNAAAETHYLVVGEHRDYRIVKVWAFKVDGGVWRAMTHYDELPALKAEMKLLTNAVVDDGRWKDFAKRHASAYNKDRFIQIRFKRDHKTQMRVQCAVPRRTLNLLTRGGQPGIVLEPPFITSLSELEGMSLKDADPVAGARKLDKFYTTDAVALGLVTELAAKIPPPEFVVEPSAGGGAFVRAARSVWPRARILAFDIEPEGEDIVRQDFLEPDHLAGLERRLKGRRVLVLGNPPFGKNSQDAVAFINAAANLGGHVAMVVPRAMEKASVLGRVDARLRVNSRQRLEDRSFTLGGAPYAVPTTFVVWELGEAAARPQRVRTVAGVKYVPRPAAVTGVQAFDVELQRVGGKAGECWPAAGAPRRDYNYFLKLDDPAKLERFIGSLRLEFAAMNEIASATTGPRSLSMPELAPFLERALVA